MKKVILSLLFLMACNLYSQQTILVDAKTEWQNTGITISQSDLILFIAKGTWTNGPAHDDFYNYFGPNGTEWWHSDPSDFLVPNVNHMSLVGKIGETGTPFGIGNSAKIIAENEGSLFLSMNDRPGGFDDNYGYIVVGVFINNLNSIIGAVNDPQTPQKSSLYQNYPNPFNPSTTIEYQIAKQGNVEIGVYDINGRLVKSLLNSTQHAGSYTIQWNGQDEGNKTVASGTYFYQVKSDGVQLVKKMLMLK